MRRSSGATAWLASWRPSEGGEGRLSSWGLLGREFLRPVGAQRIGIVWIPGPASLGLVLWALWAVGWYGGQVRDGLLGGVR